MSTKTFFLIDDDADDSELFHEAIEAVDKSVNFCFAADGKEALHKLIRKEVGVPDIIFLDINMPDMNGWQLLDRLKRDESYKDIPVIMYSTSSQKSDIKLAMDSGALCFVTKPDTFLRLKKIMEVVITHMEQGLLRSVCEAIYRIPPAA